MSQRISYLITDYNVTVNYQGQTHIVKRSDPLSDSLILAIKEHRLDDVPNLISYAKAMEHRSKGVVQVRDGELLVKGVRVPIELAKKIQKFMDEGLPFEPLVKFAENLQRNPSFRAVNELFQFLEKNDHPLTENGNFIAYKRVKGDFTDIHTGTFDNHPGAEPEIPRNEVDENCNRTCSKGLHVANWNYAHTQFASSDPVTDIMLEVEVDPAHVVAVPSDYNQAKMRVCKYKVLGVVENEYTGSSLRVVENEPMYEEEEEGDEDQCELEEDCCQECGDELCCDHTLCDNCLDAEAEVERLLEEEDEELSYEEEDEYPWEDEV